MVSVSQAAEAARMAPSSRRPIIGTTPRWEPETPSLKMPEQLAPSEAAASVFMNAILEAGGLPVMLPLTTDEGVIRQCVEMCDGFALPGGHDVNPKRFGDDATYKDVYLCEERDAFEFPLVEQILAADKPLFTTCRGTQLLNVVCGGTLCMAAELRATRPGTTHWRHTGILLDPSHPVEVREGSLLHHCVGSDLIQVNSSHHCCVEQLGESVELVGEATDGMSEAIELPGKRFCLGVQWHPEYTWQKIDSDRALWESFVHAAADPDWIPCR